MAVDGAVVVSLLSIVGGIRSVSINVPPWDWVGCLFFGAGLGRAKSGVAIRPAGYAWAGVPKPAIRNQVDSARPYQRPPRNGRPRRARSLNLAAAWSGACRLHDSGRGPCSDVAGADRGPRYE